jgi:hypothetical protein
MDAYNRATIEIGKRYGVPVVDLEGAVPKTGGYFIDDCHYTALCHRLIAAALYDSIVELDTIPALKDRTRHVSSRQDPAGQGPGPGSP